MKYPQAHYDKRGDVLYIRLSDKAGNTVDAYDDHNILVSIRQRFFGRSEAVAITIAGISEYLKGEVRVRPGNWDELHSM